MAFCIELVVPFLFFSDGTYTDYHGTGDTAERVDYTRLAGETKLIGQVIRDVAVLKTTPRYNREPVYPMGETSGLLKLMEIVKAEKKDLSPSYRLIFDDLKTRIPNDTKRESLLMATSALLAAATRAHARFFLDRELAPYYQLLDKPAIVAAIREESSHSGL